MRFGTSIIKRKSSKDQENGLVDDVSNEMIDMASKNLVLHASVMPVNALDHLPGLGLLHHTAPHALHPTMEHCFIQDFLSGPGIIIINNTISFILCCFHCGVVLSLLFCENIL